MRNNVEAKNTGRSDIPDALNGFSEDSNVE